MSPRTASPDSRSRADRCPGVTRPWLADDGALVRLRLVGGVVRTETLGALSGLAQEYGDGDLHLTSRANLQVRGISHVNGDLPAGFVSRVHDLGLLPSPAHELVRNVMVSPLSGRVGGRVDLRPVAAELDRRLLADPALARLSGRFLFVLDDGRGDLVDRAADATVVALDEERVQLRAGREQWGPVVETAAAAAALVSLARRFLEVRGDGSAWHVDELGVPLMPPQERDSRARVSSGRPSYGRLEQVDGLHTEHLPVPEARLTPQLAQTVVAAAGPEVVVTPWRSVLLPDLEPV